MYKIKFKVDGYIERYKAGLAAKGSTQTYDIDYFETFSSVAKMNIVRTVLVLASINNWYLHQMDVHNTFLQGDPNEEIYIHVPLDFRTMGKIIWLVEYEKYYMI